MVHSRPLVHYEAFAMLLAHALACSRHEQENSIFYEIYMELLSRRASASVNAGPLALAVLVSVKV